MSGNRKLLSDNPEEALRILSKRLNIPFRKAWQEEHSRHPLYPSFASFAALLAKKGVRTVALQVTFDELPGFPFPLLVYTTMYQGTFLVLDRVENGHVYMIDERMQSEELPSDFFRNIWDGPVMAFQPDEDVRYREKWQERVKWYFGKASGPFALLLLAVSLFYVLYRKPGMPDLFHLLYLCCYALGLAVSVLLLVRHFDRNNPAVNRICHLRNGDKRVDCGSILDSRAAMFLDLFSWSDFGFVYFVSLFLLGFVLPVGVAGTIGALAAFVSFPYVFYSVIYQWRIARSWCVLCLAVQAVLTLLFVVSVVYVSTGHFQTILLGCPGVWISVLLLSLSVLFVYAFVKPLLRKALLFRSVQTAYDKLRYAKPVVDYAFERRLTVSTSGVPKMEISPGKRYVVTIVFNTVCKPCMRGIISLLGWYASKSNTSLEMLFLLNPQDIDSVRIAEYLWTEYRRSPETFTECLASYAREFPRNVNEILKRPLTPQERDEAAAVIAAQDAWCIENGLTATPVVFLNGKKLPRIYTVEDLEHLCE